MRMVTRFPGGQRVDIEFDGFVVRTDQPPKAGGGGAYPTPFETFLAAIGGCAGSYVLAFCLPRGLPTTGIWIEQTWERDPATHLVREVRLMVHLPTDFPEKYRAPLIRATEQCTIKKHLEHPPHIVVTALRDGAGADVAEERPHRFGT